MESGTSGEPASGGIDSRIVGGVRWSMVDSWGSNAISFVIFVILSRLIEPEAFGLLAMGMVFAALVRSLVDRGMADALVQRARVRAEHRDTAFWIVVLTGTVLTGAGIVLAGPVAAFFGDARLRPVVAWLSAGFLFSAIGTTHHALLRRKLAFRLLAASTLTGALAGGVAGIVMAVHGFGVWSLVGQQLIGTLVGSILLWITGGWRPGITLSRQAFNELFRFGGPAVAENLVNFLNRHADDFFIGLFLGPVALGYYTMAYRVLGAGTRMLSGFGTAVAFPAFSRLQADSAALRGAFGSATQLVSLVAFPAFLGLAAVAPTFVEAAFGPAWMPSVPALRVLCLIGILHSVSLFNTSVFKAAGKPAWALGLSALYATANVAIFWISVRWGIVAVAAGYVLRGYILAPVPLAALKSLIGLPIRSYLAQFAGAALAASVMAVVVAILDDALVGAFAADARLAFDVAAGIIIYILALVALDRSVAARLLYTLRAAFRRTDIAVAEARAGGT